MLAPLLAIVASKYFSYCLTNVRYIHQTIQTVLNLLKIYHEIVGSEQSLKMYLVVDCVKQKMNLLATPYHNAYTNCNFSDKIYCYQIQQYCCRRRPFNVSRNCLSANE